MGLLTAVLAMLAGTFTLFYGIMKKQQKLEKENYKLNLEKQEIKTNEDAKELSDDELNGRIHDLLDKSKS